MRVLARKNSKNPYLCRPLHTGFFLVSFGQAYVKNVSFFSCDGKIVPKLVNCEIFGNTGFRTILLDVTTRRPRSSKLPPTPTKPTTSRPPPPTPSPSTITPPPVGGDLVVPARLPSSRYRSHSRWSQPTSSTTITQKKLSLRVVRHSVVWFDSTGLTPHLAMPHSLVTC